MAATTLLLSRHGAIDWSGRIGAPNDGLSDLGRRQALALAQRLAGQEAAALYSSTLRRAAETAEVLARHLGLEVRWDARLREWDPGDWLGLPEEEVKARYPEEWERVFADLDHPMPGGETFSQLQQRVFEFAREVSQAHPDQQVLLVSHGGALSALICHLTGLDPDALSRQYSPDQGPFVLDHCSLSLVELRDPAPVLVSLNDTAHLEGLP